MSRLPIEQSPLRLESLADFKTLDVERLPLIDDFVFELFAPTQPGACEWRHQTLGLRRSTGEEIASLPWTYAQRNVKLAGEKDVPLGTATDPYHGQADDDHLYIFEAGAYVCILEAYQTEAPEFSRWVRVPRGDYLEAWRVIRDRVHEDIRYASSLREALRAPRFVRCLWLPNQRLGHLGSEIGRLKGLRWLDLRGNELEDLPRELGALKALERLDLQNNRFDRFPEAVMDLPALSKLSTSGNASEDLAVFAKFVPRDHLTGR
jgi:Leucine-rich repeat (LRR) protein